MLQLTEEFDALPSHQVSPTKHRARRPAHCAGRRKPLVVYRAAHRLHDIKGRLESETGIPNSDTSAVNALDELVAWQPVDEAEWCNSDSWQWQNIVYELA
ncbi:hypothetical protein [Streptomyces sp. NPDC059209]|uniref:hypothetical protein n=1 Tax=Streptomyces sp. NPDC059209 TaxID=3346769 RepID=UPI00369FC883